MVLSGFVFAWRIFFFFFMVLFGFVFAVKEGDFVEAIDCFSCALEIRLGFKFVSLLMSYEKLWLN